MDELAGLLKELYSCTNDKYQSKQTVRKISDLFTAQKSNESLNLLTFALFNENGLISYIKDTLLEQNKIGVLSAIQFLQFLLLNYEKAIEPHVSKIEQLIFLIIESDTSSQIKQNVVKLLRYIFETSFVKYLQIPKIITVIDNAKDEVGPSVKSQFLSVLGIIFEKFPELIQTESERLFNFILGHSEKHKKNSILMTGYFNSICGYLVNFSAGKQQLSQVYSSLKYYLFLKKRKITPERSALTMIERHYRIFAWNIYKDIEFWQNSIEILLKKTKEGCRFWFAGTVAIYRAIAYVCESSERDVTKGKLNEFVEIILEGLMNTFNVASMTGLVELVSTGYVKKDLENRAFQLIINRVCNETYNPAYLPLSLECISKLMSRFKMDKSEYLKLVEKLAIILIDKYPRIEYTFRSRSLVALGKSFKYLKKCGDQVFNEYLQEVVYQGLIRNCSHQILTDVELVKDISGLKLISYKSYVPLWLYLLNEVTPDRAGDVLISERIFDEYLLSFLKINKKLDLRIGIKNAYATDREEAGEAFRPNDFKIFINNVSLFVDVMDKFKNPDLMAKWLPLIFTEMVNFSYRSPLISGCFNVITTCFKIADKITYFWDPANEVVNTHSESNQWFRYLQRFLQDISVKVSRFKGELQVACFQIFLAAPMKLIEPFLQDLIPVFRLILQVGSGHLPLLRECVSTLEKWDSCLDRNNSSSKESLKHLLREILPYFNVFLQSKEVEIEPYQRMEHKKKAFNFRGQIQKFRSVKTESELSTLQKHFLFFLGKLEQDIFKELIRPIDDDEDEEEWCQKLSYDIPFTDMKVRIHINRIMLRVIELSLSSTDRQTRLNACEFLHSIVLLALGNIKLMNRELNELFRKLVSTCLILGCDSDLIVFQIYEPLMMQMAHYFAKAERDSSTIFIDCLTDAASHPLNSTLRDFAAKLIRELAEWSIKYQDPGELSGNLKKILQRMYSFSVHPDHNKRCGAALIFNNIYPIIKEETDILKTHWFLLYFHFMECLSMCTICDDTSYIISSVEYIKQSIKYKSFNTCVKVPAGFGENTIQNILESVFNRCSHPQTDIRILSMSLYERIIEHQNSAEFLKIHDSAYVKPNYLKENATLKEYLTWLGYNISVFSYYNWLLVHKAMTESNLITAEMEDILGVFLDNLNPGHPWFEIHTKRIHAIIEMLQFFTSCLKIGISWHKKKVISVIKNCLFTPSVYNLDPSDVENREKLDVIFAELLPSLAEGLSNEEIDFLLAVDLDLTKLNSCLHLNKSLDEITERMNGLKVMQRLGLWHLGFDCVMTGDNVLRSVFDAVFHVRPRGTFSMIIRPGDKIILEDMLKLAAEIGMSVDVLLNLLENEEEIQDVNSSEKTAKGRFFGNLFKDFIHGYLLSKPKESLNGLLEKFKANSLEMIVNLIKQPYSENFISELCRNWSLLEALPYSTLSLLTVVKGMCLMNSEILFEENHILYWVYRIMENTRNAEEISGVFELIPYLSVVHEDLNTKMFLTVSTFYENHKFFSNELRPSDAKILTVYDGYLKGFVHTKSLQLLRFITEMLKNYENLMNEQQLTKMLKDLNLVEVPVKHVKNILTILYKEAVKISDSSIFQWLLEHFTQNCARETAWRFLLENLSDVVQAVKNGMPSLKIALLKTIQTCMTGVRKEELDGLSEENKDAFKNLILICLKREFTGEDNEQKRKYFCACFNTLCTIVVAKTNDPLQYKCLIFKDDFSILPCLIKRDEVWSLRMDFDEMPKRSKVLTSLRKTITRERQIKLGDPVNSVQYLEEETLYNSSLHDEITKYDPSNTFIRSKDADDDQEPEETGLVHIELEMDDLNKHECMPTIIAIIEHMVEDGVTTPDPDSKPFWLTSLMHRMTSLSTSGNEKIFLLKLMCNIDKYIKPYARTVIPDIFNTLIDVFGEQPINYLVIDLIIMILNWKTDFSGLDGRFCEIITRLAIYIMKNSDSYRKDIIRSNMEVAKLIVETCKDFINVSMLSAKAFEAMSGSIGLNESTIYANLHFCGVLLANSIPPWLDNKEEEFLNSVLRHCDSRKTLGKLAGLICGLTLQTLENADPSGKYVEIVCSKIEKDFKSNKLNELVLIYQIYKNYPKITNSFVRHLQVCAWKFIGPLRIQSLEMLLGHVRRSRESNSLNWMIHDFLGDMLTCDDFEVINLILQIAEAILEFLGSRTAELVDKALTFGNCKNLGVRKTICSLAITILNRWDEIFSRLMHEGIYKQCCNVLLNGMNDTDSELREKCIMFWHRKNVSPSSPDRFFQILCNSYTSETEENFLNFATRLIVRSSADSPDYQSFIFEHPLVRDSSHSVRNILKTVQPSTSTPMFAQSLTGQLSKPSLLQSLSSSSTLQTLFTHETVNHVDESSVVVNLDEDNSSNVIKRFIRDPKKLRLHFAKKSKEGGQEAKVEVELLREYNDGDFPNIQITHGDLLKPLETLAAKDPQIGRYFLSSLYDGFLGLNPSHLFTDRIRQLVKKVMNESTGNDPSFVAFLFHALLRYSNCLEADTDWVMRLAKSSGCLTLGKLLIEEMIINEESNLQERDRHLRLTPEEMKWLNLAELCRELNEFDVLRGIFLVKLQVTDDAADAIRAESESHWFRASELYESALKHSQHSLSHFYEDAYCNCLARLSDWTKLSNHVQESYNTENLWSDLRLSSKVLPWFLKSETMRSLITDGGKSIMEFVNNLKTSSDKDHHLERFFVEEIAIVHFSQGNFEWLRYQLHQMCRDFLTSWSHWNKWSTSSRMDKLMELQLLWELESCCTALIGAEKIDLVHHWSRNYPRYSDDLLTWDQRLTCREHFLTLAKKFQPDLDDAELFKSSIYADFEMVKAGIEQKNAQLSEKYIQKIKQKLETCSDSELNLMHEYYTNSLEILKEEMFSSGRSARCIAYASAVFQLEKLSDQKEIFSFESNIKLSKVMELLHSDIDYLLDDTVEEIATLLKLPLGGVKDNIKDRKLSYLEKALDAAGNNAAFQSKTYMEMVKYYRQHFGYRTEMAKYLFRAMSFRNPEARQLFCCLLKESRFADDWVKNPEIRSECKKVPTGMFLTWTNQILANLDTEMFPFLKEILLSLTEEYPNSIRYQFGFSRETYKFSNRECRAFVDELSRRLFSDPFHTDLLTAFTYVTPPDLVFKYYLDAVRVELDQIRPDWDRIVGVIQDLHKRMYGDEYSVFRGSIFDCLEAVRHDLEGLLMQNREKSNWMEHIRRLVKATPKVTATKINLKSFSPWLYHLINRNATFELPRQQNSDGNTVTIWSFKSNVIVMNSKCRPVQITVIGNDAKEYRYLIKFGEDLRQDQRIQQVFEQMNQILRDNQHTRTLSIDTYNVLPLKYNLGMIEWVNNTLSLQEVLTKTDPRIKQKMERVQQEHVKFLAGGSNVTTSVAAHLNGYLTIGRTEAVARFNERIYSFEWDLLRKGFWRMCLYPEQFVYLRNNFALSQAVIYIAHWLIGIGDRHLDNILISSTTGRALGIDFGSAFGYATESLTPPELLPFRLTPQIVNLFKPMGESVLLKEMMIQVLRALRRERSVLLEVLDVFASEPTLDWLENSKRVKKSRNEETGNGNREWNPREKIAVVRDKLEGINPVRIFTNHLISGHSDSQHLDKYLEVLHGDGSWSQLHKFTEEEQVNCLLDLATDAHILSKTYIGWNPWL